MLSTLPAIPADVSDPQTGIAVEWCVVQVRPQREATVARTIDAMGFDQFFPVERVRQLRRHRTQTIARPLYPTYLFASYADEYQRHAIRMVRDVTGILTANGHWQARLAREVDSLRRWLGEHPDAMASSEDYHEGQAVRVTGGPLALVGTVGRFIRRTRKGRDQQITRDVLLVGVEMLGTMVEVEVDALCVEPL